MLGLILRSLGPNSVQLQNSLHWPSSKTREVFTMPTTETLVYEDQESEQVTVIDKISRVLDEAGLKASDALYDEAISMARQGFYSAARDRLIMLLCMDPDNGNGHLLLAKVYGAQNRWAEALSQTEAAKASRVAIPANLLSEIEAGLEKERQEKQPASNLASKEHEELISQRAETRRLRAENTRLSRDRQLFESRVTAWASLSGVLAIVSLIFLVLFWISPSSEKAEDLTAENIVTEEATVQPVVEQVEAPEQVVEAPPQVVEAPVQEKPAPQPVKQGPKEHKVGSGDTLSKLAHQYYGDASRWPEIKKANKGKIGKNDALSLGTVLIIP